MSTNNKFIASACRVFGWVARGTYCRSGWSYQIIFTGAFALNVESGAVECGSYIAANNPSNHRNFYSKLIPKKPSKLFDTRADNFGREMTQIICVKF